ncbi:unnamed protein product [Nippostrongylus brasiliensis]|uniref:BAH domain-containing protein n=1 Tax=Nippostrongylus brasiliensis TaxID=27835 RepID=A0A0N4Y3W8_NIPBR|nr:unnamed protein product [Nippostrongylus brasiliensis]
MTTAVDKIERMHYRRRSSFIQEQRRERRETMEPLEEVEVDVVDVPKRKTPRYKSTSVCLAMVSMKSDRTDVVDFPHPTTHRCGGTSRFVVERSSILDTLDPKDLPSVRCVANLWFLRNYPTPYLKYEDVVF